MLALLKRLLLGLVLIAGASALLLMSDLGSRVKPAASGDKPAPASRTARIAVLQHASQLVLDQGRAGMFAGLAERGWEQGRNLEVKYYNAEGDMPVAQAIAKEMVGGGYDLLLTISTVSMQAVANANRAGKTPHVFGLVSDPFGAGVGISRENPRDHPAHLAGYGTMQPIALAFQTAREMNPALKVVGTVWNAAESNSEAQVKLARSVCAELGITLLEATVDNSAAVGEAANAVISRGAQAVWLGGDVTVMSAVDAVVGATRKARIPTFSVIPPNIKHGALFDLGADYVEVGRLTGLLAGDVLNGLDPATVEIRNVMPETLTLNQRALADLKDTWTISEAHVARAKIVIDANGVERTAGPSASASAATAAPVPAFAAPANVARPMRVALLQHATQPALDEGREGVIAGLADRGWVEGRNLTLRRYNPQGDTPVAHSMAKEMISGGYDLLLTITTPSTQVVANANQATKIRHVFGIVNDPYSAGLGINPANHLEHPPYLAGYASLAPVARAFRIAREMNPALASVGVVWNPAESNSESQLKMARAACAELGIKLEEAPIENSAGVGEAAAALVARRVEALFAPGDSAIMTALEAVVGAAKKGGIPVFTVIPPSARRGALFDLGADFGEVGRLTGQLAGEILAGRDPATVSIDNVVPENLMLNLQALAGLRDRWVVGETHRSNARLVIDEAGREHAKPRPASARPAEAAPSAVAGESYKIGFAYFAPEPSLESCQRGLLEGLKELGFVEGRNLTVAHTHAQGEMVNIPQMLQAMDSTDVRSIVTFSTPVLQTALTMVKQKPVVFTYVTDPLAAGAGRTFEDHAAHVTGIGSLPPIEETVKIIRRVLPQVKTLGTVYNSGEANSMKIVSMLRAATKGAGLDLVELTAASSNEVLQAMQALVSRRIDAFYMVSDNTAYLAFDAILKVAEGAKLPVIIDDPDYVDKGALFACGPGYYHSGKAAAPLLARVLRGEKPQGIPMANVSVNTTKFNRAVVAKLGLNISEALMRELETAPAAAAGAAPTSPVHSLALAATGGAATGAAATPAGNPNPTGKKWKIAYVLYNETPPAEETLHGMEKRWATSRLVAGRDYEIKVRSAQGDMASLSGIIDAVLTDGADIVVPLSTPTLQMAVQKVKRVPIVFTLVANPMAAGAGRSYTDHLPNVTGVSVLAPFAEALDVVQKHFPEYKRFGTVFCPAEANSVDLKESLEAECKRRGLVLEAVAANTPTELPDAVLSLVGRRIDAVLQVSDNMSATGFTAITRAARTAQKPLFSLNSTGVKLGAAVGFGRDYDNAGEATVAMIERVIRGEDPAKMPFELPPRVVKVYNLEHARAVGMTLPAALRQEAEEKK